MLAAWWSQLWPNLAADVLLGAPAFVHLHLRLNRHHAELTRRDQLADVDIH